MGVNLIFRAIRYLFFYLPSLIYRKHVLVRKCEKILSKFDYSQIGDEVLSGPFHKMKYDVSAGSYCSAFYPKILGSYEFELHGKIGDLLESKNYSIVIDVGCAEGYYAIGFALLTKKKGTKIFAFDTSEEAIRLCNRLKDLNNIENLTLKNSFFDNATYLNLKKTNPGPSLLFMDCEGYEIDFFSNISLDDYMETDFIIELHDFLNFGTAFNLQEKLKFTHDIFFIHSIDDLYRPIYWEFIDLKSKFSYDELYALMREGRLSGMSWLVATSKI